MSRDHHWRFRSFDPDRVEDRGLPPEEQADARIHEYGAFVERHPLGLLPSPDARIRMLPPDVPRVARPRTTRPDSRIREDICEAMTQDGWLDPREVEVTVENGHVTLTGSVEERTQKWRAEDHAEHTLGVIAVVNRIRVRKERDADLEERGRRVMH